VPEMAVSRDTAICSYRKQPCFALQKRPCAVRRLVLVPHA